MELFGIPSDMFLKSFSVNFYCHSIRIPKFFSLLIQIRLLNILEIMFNNKSFTILKKISKLNFCGAVMVNLKTNCSIQALQVVGTVGPEVTF